MHDRAPRLVLIRHSLPAIEPSIPASRWRLSAEGRERAVRLAGPLAAHRPAVVASGGEPKARETAEILAGALGVPRLRAEGLEEHHRDGAPFFASQEAFAARLRHLFERPAERAFGEESAVEARRRFAGAVRGILRDHPGATVAVVTGGTVLSLFTAEAAGWEPAPLWERLEMPSLLALRRPELTPIGGLVGVDGSEIWRPGG